MCGAKKFGIVGIIIGVAGIAYSGYVHFKVSKTNKLINTTIDDISNKVDVTVSDTLVVKAVERAVDREVNKAVKIATYDITDRIRKDINSQVRTAVLETYSDVRKSVSEETSKQVANLNIELLRNQVREDAKKMVLDKFNENLDSLLNDFNQNLNNVSKIYSNIADNMNQKKLDNYLNMIR
jgi:RNA processing factor Prp31